MKKLKFLFISILSLITTGCGTYTYNNEVFSNPSDAYARQDNLMQSYLITVDALQTPLSDKKLIVGIPDRNRIMETITGGSNEGKNYVLNIMENEYILFYRAAKKRNIYSDVELVRTDGGDLTPSDKNDLFYLKITSNNRALQWYLASTKSGRQATSIDFGLEDYKARVNSIINQIEAFAIKNSQ